MSMFVFNENIKNETKMLSFHDFILSEAIEPIKIDFGTDFENKKWYSSNGLSYTFFKIKDASVYDLYLKSNKFPGTRPYCVVIDSQNNIPEIGFATGDYTPKDIDKLKDADIMKDYFDFTLRKRSNALKIINYAFYIILEGIEYFKLNKVSFKGSNPDLIYTYSLMIKNKSFLKTLNGLGYEFIETDNDKHFLIKK